MGPKDLPFLLMWAKQSKAKRSEAGITVFSKRPKEQERHFVTGEQNPERNSVLFGVGLERKNRESAFEGLISLIGFSLLWKKNDEERKKITLDGLA